MSNQENALAAKLRGAKISEAELERRLASAEKKIQGASLGFGHSVAGDIEKALAALDGMDPDDDGEETNAAVFRVAHDLKGQGTTFGFPLVTQIAGLLCDFIRSIKSFSSEDSVSVVRAHLSALQLVLKQNIKGEGDEAARQLVDKLALAATRVLEKG